MTLARLVPGHYQELRRSGLLDETIVAAGIYSASAAEASALLGYGVGPGMAIPYPPNGSAAPVVRIKLDHGGPDGKRYRTPKGAANHIYVPPTLALETLEDPRASLYITEGEKKSLKACQEGLPCIALAGVWSWRTKAADGRSIPLPDLDSIPLAGRDVFLVFDSDVASKPEVQRAETELGAELARRGASVFAIRLPAGPGGEKVGLDDFLLTHSVETFCALEPIPLNRPPRTRAAPEPVELTELMQRDYPDDPGLVAGGLLIRRGLGIIGGSAKLGKSSLVLNLVLERAAGQPWLGFATSPGVTLVVQAEIPEPQLQKRLGIMLKGRALPPVGAVHFVTDRRIKLDRPEGLARLRQIIERLRPDLLILDPLARFMAGDENATRDMGAIVAALDELIQDYDLAVLLVHHTGKQSDAREGGHRLRGNSALFAAADTVLILDRADDGYKLGLELRHGPASDPLYLSRTPLLWYAAAGPPKELMAVAALVGSGPLRWGHFIKAMHENLGSSRSTAARLITRTQKAGLVDLDPTGFYAATAAYHVAAGLNGLTPVSSPAETEVSA
jgi:hypothetical protein